MKTGELFKTSIWRGCVGGVLGVRQSIDDGAETVLTGRLQDPLDFQGEV